MERLGDFGNRSALVVSVMSLQGMNELGQRAKQAAYILSGASRATKDGALGHAGAALVEHREAILLANEVDVATARSSKVSETVIDRLRLDDSRIESMA